MYEIISEDIDQDGEFIELIVPKSGVELVKNKTSNKGSI